jgi:hypothetical protein
MAIQLPADTVAIRLGINTASLQGKWDTTVIFTTSLR